MCGEKFKWYGENDFFSILQYIFFTHYPIVSTLIDYFEQFFANIMV